jgi:hypothetical protein
MHADRQTDTTKVTDAFRDSANAPNNGVTVEETALTITIIISPLTEVKANSCCLLCDSKTLYETFRVSES